MSDIWYSLKDMDRYLYHYTRASTLAHKILPYRRLRFSRFAQVNDPREAKEWAFGFWYQQSVGSEAERAISAHANAVIRQWCRVGCFVRDSYEALATPERNNQGEDMLAAAFERGHSRPRMWAQYGANYKGACLIFDRARLDDAVAKRAAGNRLLSGNVIYRNMRTPSWGIPDPTLIMVDRRAGAIEALAEAHVRQHERELFFAKSPDWEQEREFRWVIEDSSEADFYVDITNSLVGIALGDRFPLELKRAVGNYALANAVSVSRLRWHAGYPQFDHEWVSHLVR